MKEFGVLLHLPGTLQEEVWLREQISVKESFALACDPQRAGVYP